MTQIENSQKLLDRKMPLLLFRNDLGSYTAVCLSGVLSEETLLQLFDDLEDVSNESPFLTDAFSPSRALNLLADKVLKCGMYKDGWPPGDKEVTP